MKLLRKVFNFYVEGFRNMDKLGIKLWTIILIKLFIMFAVLRLIFFPNFLNSKFESDQEKSDYVIEQLTKPK
ncbi:MAG: DUF4492 domain-containing protein [Bacteroidales bacterium]|nr:DUF4492 domain-containing protein [Bacteroidales bacterium]MCF8398670.1 DUF4492 domain-containing protein [Bacteroidales bacterium]